MRRLLTLALLTLLVATPAAAATIPVHAGDDLQAALSIAQPGDEVVLDAGAKFVGHFQLPVKPFGLPIVVRSAALLPERQLTPNDREFLPFIESGTVEAALWGAGTSNWRLDGLELGPNAFGAGNVIELQDVTSVYMDRLLIVGGAEGQKRGILGNGRQVTLTRSYVGNIWRDGQDAQAFCAWDGAGPYDVTFNFLEASGENVMIGGADSLSADRKPADITIRGNILTKRDEWRGTPRTVKNLLELKAALRVHIFNNLLEHNWTSGQPGFAVQFTVRNQDNRAPWSNINGVLMEHNIIRDTERAFNILGYDDEHPSGQLTDVVIVDNDVACTLDSWALQIGGEAGKVVFARNTLTRCPWVGLYKGAIWPAGLAAPRAAAYAVADLAVYENIGPLQIFSSEGINEVALDLYALVWSVVGPTIPPPPPDPCVVQPAALSSPNSPVKWPGSANGDKFIEMTLRDRRKCPLTIKR